MTVFHDYEFLESGHADPEMPMLFFEGKKFCVVILAVSLDTIQAFPELGLLLDF